MYLCTVKKQNIYNMKVKLITLAIASLLVFGTATAQKKKQQEQYNGGITTEMMQQMKKGFGGSASDKALRNITSW